MLIKNVKLAEKNENVDLRITDGKFVAIQAGLKPNENEQVINGNGNLALPPYIDSHVHLDTTMTAGQPQGRNAGCCGIAAGCFSARRNFIIPTWKGIDGRSH